MKAIPSIKPSLSINAFGKNRFFLGLSIATFCTVIAYGFLFFLRELFKLFSTTFNFPNQIWKLDPTQMVFHDFILAMLACQIGQMIFFEFYLSKPTLLTHWNFRKRTILVDNRNLLSNFLFFGLKIGVAIGLFFSYEMLALFHVNGLVVWLLILTVISLHLHAWMTINRTFKYANQWMIKVFGLMIICATMMSQVHPIDYLSINKFKLQKIPDYHLKIALPSAEIGLIPSFSYRHIDFTLQYKNGKIQLAHQYKMIDWKDIPSVISKAKKYTPPYAQAQLFASVTIDKNVPMGLVFKLKQSLRSNDINKISYTILPSDSEFQSTFPFNRQYGLMDKMILTCKETDLKESLLFLKKTKTLENLDDNDIDCAPFSFMWTGIALSLQDNHTIHLDKKGNIYIDNHLVKQKYLLETFEKLLMKEKLVELFLVIDESVKYDQYIQLRVAIKQARQRVLNQASEKEFGLPYSEDLPTAQRKLIYVKHPFSIIEPNSKTELAIYRELERIEYTK